MKRPVIAALTADVPDEKLLTPTDLAAIASVSVSFARSLLNECKIPGAVRFGHQIRIPAGELRAFMESERLPRNRRVFDLRERMRGHKASA